LNQAAIRGAWQLEHTPNGKGQAVVKEVIVCPACAAENSQP
jgi:hypothetical protein